MTEHELREKVVKTACTYLGAVKGSVAHHHIIDIYNAHKPLPRGYAVTYYDDWCATFVSSIGIESGMDDIIAQECGCGQYIDRMKAKGAWVENDSYIPKPGDIILYDWEDNGVGDNLGYPNHIGIVVSCDGKSITVIEGNMGSSSCVGKRTIAVNGKFIRGFCVPNYKSKVVNAVENEYKPQNWSEEAREWAEANGIIKGDGTGMHYEQPVNREQMVTLLHRLYNLIK